MLEAEILIMIIKLVLGGIAAFLAILVWSKTRDGAWFFLVSGTILGYCGIVFDMLRFLFLDGLVLLPMKHL